MKIICAWCKKTLAHKCPHCGNQLQPDPQIPGNLICRNGQSNLSFTPHALSTEPTSHGICDGCANRLNASRPKPAIPEGAERQDDLSDEDRANLAALDTPTPEPDHAPRPKTVQLPGAAEADPPNKERTKCQ